MRSNRPSPAWSIMAASDWPALLELGCRSFAKYQILFTTYRHTGQGSSQVSALQLHQASQWKWRRMLRGCVVCAFFCISVRCCSLGLRAIGNFQLQDLENFPWEGSGLAASLGNFKVKVLFSYKLIAADFLFGTSIRNPHL